MEAQNIDNLLKLLKKERLTSDLIPEYERELFYLECNPDNISYLLGAVKTHQETGIKTSNPNNSVIIYLLGLTDEKPKKPISQTPTTLPDIDYDTDARDQIKAYLSDTYGQDNVSLLGTFNTLKTKGAIKDVLRQVMPEMSFDDVNRLTKKFDVIKRTDEETIRKSLIDSNEDYSFISDYSSETAFFYACLEADSSLKEWFDKYPKIKDAVIQLLGNAKSTGVHAGGIVVSNTDIKTVVPLTFDRTDKVWVTQSEMSDVESAGLIKYDFLGLNTLGDLNRCLKLVKERHGIAYTLGTIPLEDKDVLKDFQKGKTISVFQFNTGLATSILVKLRSIDSVDDLAVITSIARPGPLNMGMDKTFIARKNGDEPVQYEHPLLEPILKDTYGIFVYQEQIMTAVRSLGGLSADESLTVMKAMGKKQRDNLVKFKDRFLDYAKTEHRIPPETAQRIWSLMESFAEYGFNKSHAIAYACVSYLCMWLKRHYSLEWISAVLTGANKDDFKKMYGQWSDKIEKPTINLSKSSFIISPDGQKVVMPFNAVNGVGAKAVEAIIETQPFASFQDFFERIDKRKVNKGTVINLIFSGCFDCFKDESESFSKFRKGLIYEFISLRHKLKKPAKKEREEDELFLRELEGMGRNKILVKENMLLNFNGFDYFDFYRDKFEDLAKSLFGSKAITPEEALSFENGKDVVVGGAVEEIRSTIIKTGKFAGKEKLIVKICHGGHSIEINLMPWHLETRWGESDPQAEKIRKLDPMSPIIFKGSINIWNENVSVSFKEAILFG